MVDESPPLRIVMVHYHLRRGGVTRAIESARESLAGRGFELLVLSGEEPPPHAPREGVRVVPALNYRRRGSSVIAESLAQALESEAVDSFGAEPDVWHFHNPTLAKNVLLPTAIRELAERGNRIVLQPHDFAEDGRPGNYTAQRSFFDSDAGFESTLYPRARQIHYATLNRRDHDFLAAAGIPRSNVHVVPNAVAELPVKTAPEGRSFSRDRLFGLYPSRGIRRKNIGELLLLALIYGDRVDFATTMSPENSDWKPVHDRWAEAVEELGLPVTLGIADRGDHDFHDLLGWSDFVVTTSIGEGFGLAFLEPWMAGKCVLGRDLPEITRDFREAGVGLAHLYARIDLPVEWFDRTEIEGEIGSMLRRSYLAYDRPLPRGAVKRTWKAWVRQDGIDFGVLNETLQLRVLRWLKDDPRLLDRVGIPPLSLSSVGEVRTRREAIRRTYSLERYGDRLENLYRTAASSRVGKVRHLPPARVLAQFLEPARLNLLRN